MLRYDKREESDNCDYLCKRKIICSAPGQTMRVHIANPGPDQYANVGPVQDEWQRAKHDCKNYYISHRPKPANTANAVGQELIEQILGSPSQKLFVAHMASNFDPTISVTLLFREPGTELLVAREA